MQSFNIIKESTIKRTSRVIQVESLFDVPPSEKKSQQWNVSIDLDFDWNIGLIVGESGCGKTTIASELFGNKLFKGFEWGNNTIIDDFPKNIGIKELTYILSSVGFSSPPLWLKPYSALSNGQKFRVDTARILAEMQDIAVMDEFTSVVDRDIAKIASYSVQKAVRQMNKKFVAVSCHYDIIDHLQPDWIYYPTKNIFEKKKTTKSQFIKSKSKGYIQIVGKFSKNITI